MAMMLQILLHHLPADTSGTQSIATAQKCCLGIVSAALDIPVAAALKYD